MYPWFTPRFTSPTTDTLKVCNQKDWLSPSSHVSLVHTPLHQPHYRHSQSMQPKRLAVVHHHMYPWFTPHSPAPLPTFTVCHQKDWLSSIITCIPRSHPLHTPFTSPTTDTLTVCHQKDWLSSIITCIPGSHPFHRPHHRHTQVTRM